MKKFTLPYLFILFFAFGACTKKNDNSIANFGVELNFVNFSNLSSVSVTHVNSNQTSQLILDKNGTLFLDKDWLVKGGDLLITSDDQKISELVSVRTFFYSGNNGLETFTVIFNHRNIVYELTQSRRIIKITISK
jgi:hypothetical protein